MTQYAYFDASQPSPSPVIGWYDTAALHYPSLPAESNLLPLTAAQWGARLTGEWAVAGGALVAYEPPVTPPSLAQQAQMALAAGLTIASAGTPAIDGAYAVDPATQAKIAAVEVYIIKNGTFPGGAASYAWPTLAGGFATFPSVAVYQTWATAIADYVSALDIIAAVDSGALPAASVTIA